MIHTIGMKIAYFVILIIAALFSVLYLGEFSVLLLCILIIIPVFLRISLLYIKCNLIVSVKTPVIYYHRNKPQSLQLVVKNNGILPVSKAIAFITCMSIADNERIPIVINFSVPARNVTIIDLMVTAAHCGLTEVRLKNLVIYDYIRLFSRKIRKSPPTEILTLPSGEELPYKINVPCSITDEESNVYSKLREGDDPSEIYRIREYRVGDMQKRIHWKLSSRTDTIWVKEYSLPIKQRTAIIIDYFSQEEESVDLMDTALEAAYTISMAFIKQEIPFNIYWMSSESRKLVWNEIHSMTDLNNCFTTLLSHPPIQSYDLLSHISDMHTLYTTNAIYYCTPHFNTHDIDVLHTVFCQNHIYVLTSSDYSKQNIQNENIIFIRESYMSKDLEVLSSMEVNRE